MLGVKSAPKDSTGVIGNPVVLECDPTEQTGVITWLHNGTDITVLTFQYVSVLGNRLIITRVIQSSHSKVEIGPDHALRKFNVIHLLFTANSLTALMI